MSKKIDWSNVSDFEKELQPHFEEMFLGDWKVDDRIIELENDLLEFCKKYDHLENKQYSDAYRSFWEYRKHIYTVKERKDAVRKVNSWNW